ncbi:RBBP9/YdeN family alpha/beta hydrolase [Craterilacuibacter sp.]|uniref:RBBP9/YdeN family alpha/beta hydrolase n=1 Tax=Craterilacuibacter sp. TaxID=2870909 RepID=UPI003F2FD673
MPPFSEAFDFLIQPGWNDSAPEHWQSHWQQLLGAQRVCNRDWALPLRSDWLSGLHQAIAKARKPVVVIAHSLGCITVAHYAQLYPQAIAAALLVAPADVERADAPAPLQNFAPAPLAELPFPARVVASRNDPFCPAARAQEMASHWNVPIQWLDDAGHINVASGHYQWQEGLASLEALLGEVLTVRA